AARTYPEPNAIRFFGCVGAGGREHEHHPVRRRGVERSADLVCRMAHRLREQKRGRSAVCGIAAGAVLGRILVSLGDIRQRRDRDGDQPGDDPASSSLQAATAFTGWRNGAATWLARSYVATSTPRPP